MIVIGADTGHRVRENWSRDVAQMTRDPMEEEVIIAVL